MEGVKPVKASSSTQQVESKPTDSKDEDDDDTGSADTNLGDDPPDLKEFKASIQNFNIPQQDLDKINFKGGGGTRKEQYPLLRDIAKNLHQKTKIEEFLDKTTDEVSGGKHKIKSVNELKIILEELKKT